MISHLSQQLNLLKGYVGHIQIDLDMRLTENSTNYDLTTAMRLSGAFVGYLKQHESSSDPVRSLAVVCGQSVYFSRRMATGYLILQLARNQSLAGVRKAISEIFGESSHSISDTAEGNPQQENPPDHFGDTRSAAPVWNEFRAEILKLLSPIAPGNIANRMIDNAFTKAKIPIGSHPKNTQIYNLTLAILNEIPNPARRKSAETEALRLLDRYKIRPS